MPSPGGASERAGRSFVIVSLLTLVAWHWLGAGTAIAGIASSGGPACLSADGGIQVRYLLGEGGTPSFGVAGLELSGFDMELCDGKPVKVTLHGNPAGDAAAPASVLLSTLDPSRDSCSGEPMSDPGGITDGRVTLHACASGTDPTRGVPPDLHDLTQIRVEVDGRPVPLIPGPEILGLEAAAAGGTAPQVVGSEPAAGPGPAAEILGSQGVVDGAGLVDPAHPGTSGVIPNTGGPQMLMLWLGVLLVLWGLVSLVWDHVGPRHGRSGPRDQTRPSPEA